MSNDILNRIKIEENNIIEKLSEPNEEVEFLENFLMKNNLQSILNLLDIDFSDLMIAYISSNNEQYSFDYIKQVIDKNKDEINDYNSESASCFLYILTKIDKLVNSYKYDDIIKAMETKTKSKDKDFQNEINFLKTLNDNLDVIDYINLCSSSKNEMFNLIGINISYKKIKESYDECMVQLGFIKKMSHIKIKDKEAKSYFKDFLSNNYKVEFIEEKMQQILESITKKINNYHTTEKQLKKEIKNYNIIEQWLNSQENNEEYVNVPSELAKIQNASLALDIIKNIYLHNQDYYKKINDKFENLLKNSHNKLKKLFAAYSINIDDYNINFKEPIDIISKKLEYLKNINIKDKNTIMNIIRQATIENIEAINELYSDGYITAEFIENNNKIFTSNYNNFISNINLLKDNNISKNIIIKLNNNLNINTSVLSNNINIINDYKLLNYLKNSKNYSFLNENNLNTKIDKLLELGLEKQLKNDLGLLNKDEKLFDRVLILKSLNIEIKNNKELNQQLEITSFIVNDENINDYIFDISPYLEFDEEEKMSKDDFLNLLEEKDKKISKRVYSFNGILISKNKVKNNINNIDNTELTKKQQFNCLISNKILPQEDFDNLYSHIYNIKYQYTKK